jgi:RNA polymerase sigma factor (sigma-70 family)
MSVNKNNFIRLIDNSQTIINKICYSYTNNTDDRLDLKQEILIQLWKAYPKFNNNSQVSTWVYKVALNTAISNFRKVKNKISFAEYDIDKLNFCEDNTNTELDDNILKLYQLIYRLNDLEKAIMLLYLDNKVYKEIAEVVGITESNVATKINRIKSKLRKHFSE